MEIMSWLKIHFSDIAVGVILIVAATFWEAIRSFIKRAIALLRGNKKDDGIFMNQSIGIDYVLSTPNYFNHAKERSYRITLSMSGVFLLFAEQCLPDCREYRLLDFLQKKCLKSKPAADFLGSLQEFEREGESLEIIGQDVLKEARKFFSLNSLFDFSKEESRRWTLTEKGKSELRRLEKQKNAIEFVISFEELDLPPRKRGRVIRY
ncbi:hypothetical protein AGMMS50276_28460 [Synergistales bacterium]|nr:hypothetical protein AGMMS50276_28460 [Synergistales bacterium]